LGDQAEDQTSLSLWLSWQHTMTLGEGQPARAEMIAEEIEARSILPMILCGASSTNLRRVVAMITAVLPCRPSVKADRALLIFLGSVSRIREERDTFGRLPLSGGRELPFASSPLPAGERVASEASRVRGTRSFN
jgi:hypothetical protein